MSLSLSSGAHSPDPLAHPRYTCWILAGGGDANTINAELSREADSRQSTSRIKARADSLHLEAADPHRLQT
jgi:hypothetical protein